MRAGTAPGPLPPGTKAESASATTTADTTVIPELRDCQFICTTLVVHNAHATSGTGITLKNVANSTGSLGPLPAPPGNGGMVLDLSNSPVIFQPNLPAQFACQAGVTTVTVTMIGYYATKQQ